MYACYLFYYSPFLMKKIWAAHTLFAASPPMRRAWCGLSATIVAAIHRHLNFIFLISFSIHRFTFLSRGFTPRYPMSPFQGFSSSHYSLLTSHYSHPNTHISLLTSHFSLLKSHYSLLTSHISLLNPIHYFRSFKI